MASRMRSKRKLLPPHPINIINSATQTETETETETELFMPSERQQLLTLLAQKSFRLGEFKLSAGGTSDYYIDCRATTLDAEGARLTSRVFLDEIYRRGWTPTAIGGLTMGADPIVVGVAMLTAQQVQARALRGNTGDEGWLIHGFLVRKAEKAHGTGQRIEGFREKGTRVVIVDDVCTTGASTVQALEAARAFGFEVAGVICLVERLEAQGRPNVERAAAPASFVSIFTSADIREEHLRLQKAAAAPAVKQAPQK
jgi:orotate phosphoribosyltransferase